MSERQSARVIPLPSAVAACEQKALARHRTGLAVRAVLNAMATTTPFYDAADARAALAELLVELADWQGFHQPDAAAARLMQQAGVNLTLAAVWPDPSAPPIKPRRPRRSA